MDPDGAPYGPKTTKANAVTAAKAKAEAIITAERTIGLSNETGQKILAEVLSGQATGVQGVENSEPAVNTEDAVDGSEAAGFQHSAAVSVDGSDFAHRFLHYASESMGRCISFHCCPAFLQSFMRRCPLNIQLR
eukprot:SAG31_NODE_5036_length_2787_cov_1.736979_2_plen_134_part_00